MKILKYYATNKPHNLRKMTRLALLTIDSTMISRINSIIELHYRIMKLQIKEEIYDMLR